MDNPNYCSSIISAVTSLKFLFLRHFTQKNRGVLIMQSEFLKLYYLFKKISRNLQVHAVNLIYTRTKQKRTNCKRTIRELVILL